MVGVQFTLDENCFTCALFNVLNKVFVVSLMI